MNPRMKRFFMIAAAAIAIFASCKKNELVPDPLTVSFTVSPSEPVTESEAIFTIDLKGGEFPFTYEWNFGDGITGNRYEEKVIYETPGKKTVTVKVTDCNGSEGFAEQTINVRDKSDVPQIEAPRPKAVKVTDRTVSIQWAITEEPANDGTYRFELLEGTTLLNKDCKEGKFESAGIMSFGGLKPATAYKFRVMRPVTTEIEPEEGEESKIDSDWAEVEFTTEAAPAAISDAVICERFDNFIWGPDYVLGGYGLRATDEKGATSLNVPAGTFTNGSTGSYFATFTEEFRNNTNTLKGWNGSAVYGYVGVAKFGSSSAYGMLETPALGTAGNFSVTFDVLPYPGDNTILHLSVSGGGTVDRNTIELGGRDTKEWKTETVNIIGATVETKFRIESDKEIAAKQRFALDNILIVPAASDIPVIGVDMNELTFPSEGDQHTVKVTSNTRWTAVPDAEWISVSPDSGESGETDVIISVGANAENRNGTVVFRTVSGSGDEAEAQTEVRQISKEMLATPVRLSEEVTHNALFFRWDDVEGTTRYHFELVKESAPDSPLNAVTEIDFANDYSYRPAIVTGNLEPQTAYIFRVKALAADDAHADSEYLTYEFTTPSAADESGYVLCERFDNFVWGSDYLRSAWGFRPSDTKSAASLSEPATVVVKPKDQINYLFFDDASKVSFTEDFINGQFGLEGWSGYQAHVVFGMLKLGNWNTNPTHVQTPELGISGTADVRLSFDWCPWWDEGKTTTDSGKISVEVTGGGTAETSVFENTFTVPCSMKTVSTVIRGATSSTRIRIVPDTAQKGHRAFIDNIIVEKL